MAHHETSTSVYQANVHTKVRAKAEVVIEADGVESCMLWFSFYSFQILVRVTGLEPAWSC